MVIQSLEHLTNLGSVLICYQLLGDAGLLLLIYNIRDKSVCILRGVVGMVHMLK